MNVWRNIFILVLTSGNFLSAQAQNQDLDYYLHRGLMSSPLLQDYRNQLKAVKADSLLIRAAQQPQVLANGQIMVAPTLHGYGYDPAVTNGGNYQAVVSVTQPLFTRKALEPQYQHIALQRQSTTNTARISSLDLEKKITGQYLTAYADYQQWLSNKEVYGLLQAQQALLRQLVQQGTYTQTDYLTLQVALQMQEITLTQLYGQYKTDISTLNYLCGIEDTAVAWLSKPVLKTWPAVGSAQSVFSRQFILDSLQLLNNRALVDAKYRPTINWFADAGLQSSQPASLYRNFGASFGVNLSVPLYDGKQRQVEYQRLQIEEDTRNHYASFFDKQYHQQLAMLMQQLKAVDDLVRQIRDRLSTSRQLMDMNKQQLSTGDLRVTDYIAAINNYLSVQNNLNQAVINRDQLVNQLNYWHH